MEVKSTVGGHLNVVDPQHLAQLLVQCYYTMEEYKIPKLLGALMDSVSWHFFGVKRCPTGPDEPLAPMLNIEWGMSFIDLAGRKPIEFLASSLEYLNGEH